jgi:DNA-binding IscR family transcriptional regulator
MEEFERAGEKGAAAVAVYCALALLRARSPAEHRQKFYADYGAIAKLSALSRRSLPRIIEKLEAAGVIRVHRPAGVARLRHEASQYTLLPVVVAGNLIVSAQKCAPGSANVALPEVNRSGALDCAHSRGSSLREGDSTAAADAGAPVGAPAGGAVKGGDDDRWL